MNAPKKVVRLTLSCKRNIIFAPARCIFAEGSITELYNLRNIMQIRRSIVILSRLPTHDLENDTCFPSSKSMISGATTRKNGFSCSVATLDRNFRNGSRHFESEYRVSPRDTRHGHSVPAGTGHWRLVLLSLGRSAFAAAPYLLAVKQVTTPPTTASTACRMRPHAPFASPGAEEFPSLRLHARCVQNCLGLLAFSFALLRRAAVVFMTRLHYSDQERPCAGDGDRIGAYIRDRVSCGLALGTLIFWPGWPRIRVSPSISDNNSLIVSS